MKHVWDIDYCPKKEIAQMSVFELREYTKRLEEELTNKDKTIRAIIDGNRRKHGEWLKKSIDFGTCWATCSVCNKVSKGKAHDNGFGHDYSYHNFCPNCGADMRKEGERNE